ncbi:squalene/phytoene synthase family protein [Kribbella sp. VKM Ac-2566]|uniref:squalene/phytoene synthase family protein n=1 Tax=Kribbella sp. VKM Ac-2566 TaxID=2512218 RepID=UPI00106336E7|nr:squalene/phytoene synthase family protein [Kribbella sp. VKM Ac-2566]TDW92192.1 farnesyl-diphosphate farnesyltransferase [Kribbella sp. VKM Ac-2566]
MKPTVAEAYAACLDITRAEARNFSYGIRLLPPPKRNALSALYALARRIDDIGDGDLPLEDKRNALAGVRKDLGRLDDLDEPVYVAVADTARRYPVPLGAFEELVAGVETDLCDVRIADFDELVVYCRRVAGSVGRLCLSIFGPSTGGTDFETLALYADQLGIALQQTNILRDIREDFTNGRIYLPSDELEHFGARVALDEHGALDDPQGRLAGYIRYAAGRAQDWYSLGWRLLPYLDRRSGASCRAMSGIYHHLLRRIGANPVLVYDQRLSLSAGEKAQVALASLAGRRKSVPS